MNRSVLFSLAGVLAFATLGGFYLAQPSPLTARVQELESRLNAAQSENVRLKSECEKLQAVKKATPPPASVATASPAATATRPGGSVAAVSKDGQAADGVPLLNKERMRETMNRMHEGQLDVNYGKLFKTLGLNAEEEERFKKLILERQTKQSDIGMKLGEPNQTAEQKKAIMGEMTAARKESDAAIRHFLDSDEDNNTFKQWEETKGDRLQVQMALPGFDAVDAPLSVEQREQLISAITAARKAQPPSASLPNTPASNVMEKVRARETAIDQSVLQQAAEFLSPEQLAIFEKAQLRRRDMFYRPPGGAK